MTYNEGDRWNGKPHGPAVDNPAHSKRLRCPVCHRPAFMKPGDDKCWWCREIDRNEAEDNTNARQQPNGY